MPFYRHIWIEDKCTYIVTFRMAYIHGKNMFGCLFFKVPSFLDSIKVKAQPKRDYYPPVNCAYDYSTIQNTPQTAASKIITKLNQQLHSD